MTRQQPLSAAICSAKFCKSMTGQMSGAATRALSVVHVETLIADKINVYFYANTLMIPAALRNLMFTKSTNFEIIIAKY